MDFGGDFQENMTRGQDDFLDFGGTVAENIGRLSGSTTGDNYTTDSKGNVYKNGDLYRTADSDSDYGYSTDSLGNIYKDGSLYRAANSDSDSEAVYTKDSLGNTYKNGTLYRAADEVIKKGDNVYEKKSTVDDDGNIKTPPPTITPPPTKTPPPPPPKGTTPDGKKGMDPMMMMMLMLMLSQMGKGGGGGGSSSGATIPSLSANRSQLPYSPPSRPGAGGTTYFSPTTYAPRMAGGGEIVMAGGGGISSLGGYSDGGRLLKGPGDGVSDNIPATIAGKQPARLANGEFVVPARIVSELGNGSTDAGAKRLYEMMDRVQKARRKTKNVAADTKARKYLPA
jgi:hypothetical protein